MGCCNVVDILSMGDMVCLDGIQKLCSAQAMLGLHGMLEFKLCCEILLLLNMADMGRLLCVRLEYNAEYLVYSMCTNRLESFVVCIVGKMAQDVGMV